LRPQTTLGSELRIHANQWPVVCVASLGIAGNRWAPAF